MIIIYKKVNLYTYSTGLLMVPFYIEKKCSPIPVVVAVVGVSGRRVDCHRSCRRHSAVAAAGKVSWALR